MVLMLSINHISLIHRNTVIEIMIRNKIIEYLDLLQDILKNMDPLFGSIIDD